MRVGVCVSVDVYAWERTYMRMLVCVYAIGA